MDAVVIGAGPNGLVAANVLADAGWRVVVLEATSSPGGAVASGRVTAPGYLSDLYSAFYPLGYASPALTRLGLERFGLRWLHAPLVLANPLPDGRCAVLSRDLATTCASLEELAAGDGVAWRRLYELWQEVGPELLDALFTPFPPVRAGLRLARRLRLAGGLRFARLGTLPVRTLAEESFAGEGGRLLLAGSTLHTDLGPESAGGAIFGWLLAMLGQQVGFPVPAGGAGELTAALVRRLAAGGGLVECDFEVDRVLVRGGRAVAVRARDGREVAAGRAVLADVDAPRLYRDLVGAEHLPAGLLADLGRFGWDHATVKVDWALDGPVPWRAGTAAGAGTVHLAADMDQLTRYSAELATGRLPAEPFLLFGQMSVADPARSPAGTESAWGYTHVPQRVRGDAGGRLSGRWQDEAEVAEFAARMERQVEAFAPGFTERVLARHVRSPHELERENANLRQGALNGGTAAIHQQLLFRPTMGLGRPETAVRGLYLASASAHPGGGVHGGPGWNAARAALHAAHPPGRWVAAGLHAAQRRLQR